MFSGDAWIYCISKNEWVQFEHNYSEKPRYGKQFPGSWVQKGWWLPERGHWFLLTALLLFHVSQRCRWLCAPRILGEGHTGQAVCETAGNTEFRVCSWGLRFDVAAEDSEL